MRKRQSDSLAAITSDADVAKFNNAVEDFALDSVNRLKNNIRGYDAVDTGAMLNKLNYRLKYDLGEVDRISYPMQRYAILLQHGVGRGQKAGEEGPRSPRPWFNDLWNTQGGLADLGDIVSTLHGDIRSKATADSVSRELEDVLKKGIKIKL
jgi:hypothetical protein